MKPHLPLKLRAALLAALVAVSFTVYSPAWAAETGDPSTETKVYEHDEPWTERIIDSPSLDSYAEINISNESASNGAGSAIWLRSGSVVSITNSGNILFMNNSSSSSSFSIEGGAVSNDENASLDFTGNVAITFSGNSAVARKYHIGADGGAVYNKSTLAFTNNGDITFFGNYARIDDSSSSSSYGGAIYNYGTLTFSGNDSVLFEKNYEKNGDSYRLRSIYSNSGSLYLAAKEGGYIAFKDSLYSGSDANCFFNACLDGNGSLTPSYGEIIFTGESTEEDLAGIMGSAPTEDQITESRTSYVGRAATLYGGTLSIREQAILQGVGLTVQTSATKGGTRVVLCNGTLSMSGRSIAFRSGTVLDAQGHSSVDGYVTMAADSTLRFTLGEGEAASPILTLTGTLVQEGYLSISLAGNAPAGTYTLLSVSHAFDKTNWTEDSVTVLGASFDDLSWDEQGKILYYTGESALAPTVIWNGGNGGEWNSYDNNWQADGNDSTFANGMNVRFTDAGAGSVVIMGTLEPGSIVVVNSVGKDYTFNGMGEISGNAELTKRGAGKLTINTMNPNWTGDIKVKGGTLIAGSGTALGTGDVTMNGGDLDMGGNALGNAVNVNADATINGGGNYQGGLTLNSGTVDGGELNLGQNATVNSGTINNNLTGTGGVINENGGTVTLNGSNSYAGGTTVSDGTLVAGSNTALGTGGVTMKGGDLNLGGWDLTNDIIVTHDGVLNGAGDYRGTLTLRSGTLTGSSINIAADKTFVLEQGALDNKLTGEGGVIKNTVGSVTLNGNNTFAGGTAVSAGILKAGHASAFGTGTVTLGGGTLNLNGQAVANAVTATGGTLDGAEAYTGALTVNGSVTLAGTTTAGSLAVDGGSLSGGSIEDTAISASSGTLSSTISGTSSVATSGEVTLDSANDYTGATTVSGGTLTVGNVSALGGSTVALNGTLHMGGLAVGNTVNIATGELGTIVDGSAFAGTVNLNGGTLNLASNLGGALALNGGLLDLSDMASATLGTVTTSSLTSINVGDLSGLGEGTHSLLSFADGSSIDTSKLDIVGLDDITSWDTALEIQNNDLVLVLSALPQITDDIILDSGNKVLDDVVTPGSIQVSGDEDSSITGSGSIAGDGNLDKTGSGTLVIDTENPNWTGDTTISDGTLVAGSNTALGTGDVNLNGGSLNMSGWDLNNDTIVTQDSVLNGAGDFRGTLTLRSGTLTGGSINIAEGKVFVLEQGTLDNKLTGDGGVIKNTDDSVTLNGNNTFAGGTAVSAGTLTAGHASAFGTGTVTLGGGTLNLNGQAVANAVTATGGTLDGAGAYTGALTVNGSVTLAGTTTAGSLAVDGGSLSGGSINDTEISASSGTLSSAISGTSSVTTDGEVTLGGANNYTGATTVSGGTLTVGNVSALGGSTVALNGTLNMGGLAVGNTVNIATGELGTIVDGSAFAGTVNLNGGTLNLTGDLGGALALNGGLLNLTTGVSTLSMDTTLPQVQLGTVTTSSLTSINVGDISGLAEGTHSLLSFADGSGIDTSKLDIVGLDAITSWDTALEIQDNDLVLVLSALPQITDDIILDGDNKVLDGVVTPGAIQVSGDEDSSITGSGSIAGDGDLDKTGSGTLVIDTENPDWTGDTTISGGTVTAGSNTALGTGDVTMNGGSLNLGGWDLNNDIIVTQDSVLNGAGDYRGTLTLRSGTLTGGSINIAEDKVFVLEQGTLDNKLTGDGGVIKNTDGSVTLNGNNSYEGGTIVEVGTLTAGSEKAFGTGGVTVNGGTLDLNEKAIANTIRLNDGATLQNGGEAGNIAAAVGAGIRLDKHRISRGQTMTFGGNNRVAGKVSFGGGTLVLNSPNLTFTDVVSIVPGSVTTLDVSAFGSALAESSVTELIDFAGGFENYTEGSLSVIGVGEGLTPSLQFDAATGKLALEVSAANKPEEPVAPPSYKVDPATLGSNSSAVYTQLADAARENRYDGVLGALARAVAETTDAAELKELLGQVNGSIYTTQMSAQIDGNRAAMSTLRDLMGYGQEPVHSRRGYRFAVQATGSAGSTDGDTNAPGYDRRSFGGLLMAERSVAKRIVVGLSAGYEHANVEADSSGKWESDDTRLSAHLLALGKAWQSRSILGFGMHEYDMKRNVNAGGISGTAQSSPSGFSVNVMEEVAYLVKLNERSSAEPFLRIESSYNSIDSATESGSLGNAALEIDSQDAWATTVTLGARYLRQFTMRGALPVSRLMVEAGISKSIGAEGETLTAHFAGDPAHSSCLTPAERDRWGVTLGGSFLLPLSSKQMINIGAKIQLRGSSTEANANAGYQVVF